MSVCVYVHVHVFDLPGAVWFSVNISHTAHRDMAPPCFTLTRCLSQCYQ